MELLAGGSKGFRCAKFKVPQLVLHPETHNMEMGGWLFTEWLVGKSSDQTWLAFCVPAQPTQGTQALKKRKHGTKTGRLHLGAAESLQTSACP